MLANDRYYVMNTNYNVIGVQFTKQPTKGNNPKSAGTKQELQNP